MTNVQCIVIITIILPAPDGVPHDQAATEIMGHVEASPIHLENDNRRRSLTPNLPSPLALPPSGAGIRSLSCEGDGLQVPPVLQSDD